MKVFISWSGERSLHVAKTLTLRGWLKKSLHNVQPWMSEDDIGASRRWELELSRELEDSEFGILCVTPENRLGAEVLDAVFEKWWEDLDLELKNAPVPPKGAVPVKRQQEEILAEVLQNTRDLLREQRYLLRAQGLLEEWNPIKNPSPTSTHGWMRDEDYKSYISMKSKKDIPTTSTEPQKPDE